VKYWVILIAVLLVPVTNSFAQSAPEIMIQTQPISGTPSSNVIEGTEYNISSVIDGGEVLSIIPDPDAASLIFDIVTTSDGEITITLPRELIDAKIGSEDDVFFVLVDGAEVDFTESNTATHRFLTVPFVHGSEEIEVIGTFVVPEFPIAILVLSIAIVASIFMLRFPRNLKLQI
jgi:hypothetical protein